jgi:type IV secretory pathway VirB10-like protein
MATADSTPTKEPTPTAAPIPDQEEDYEQLGGGRFNRLLIVAFVTVAIVGGVVLALGVQSTESGHGSAAQKTADDQGASARDRGEVEDLAANGARRHAAAPAVSTQPLMPIMRQPVRPSALRPPSRYAQWAEEKYLRALEAPQMVSAFHASTTLEIASAKAQPSDSLTSSGQSSSAISVHPAASAFTVMAGSIVPAVLISGINSDLPGPILAQVSQNVLDSATGRSVLIPQGSRLIGTYQNASSYGQQRVQIAWQRLIFPDTASMDLPLMPGADQAGYAGLSDQVDHHYLATFGTAAVMSLISAGQTVGQMATLGGGGYGAYGYYQPNQWAMASQSAGSAASGQFGSLGQQMMGEGLNRPATLEIRPGFQFEVMVTQDLVFPGPYAK